MLKVVGRGGPTGVIADELTREIAEGKYEVGERFSTEMQLRERFGVGRHTIREALKLLAEQGLIGRRRKTGTFVLSTSPVSPYVHSLRDLRGLLDFAEATRLQITRFEDLPADSQLLKNFDNLGETRWTYIAGIRMKLGEAKPLCFSEILIPTRFCPSHGRIREAKRGIYEETIEQNSLHLEYIEQEVSATVMSADVQRVLEVDDEVAALFVKRRYVARMGETFEISHTIYPASRYKIHNVIRQRE